VGPQHAPHYSRSRCDALARFSLDAGECAGSAQHLEGVAIAERGAIEENVGGFERPGERKTLERIQYTLKTGKPLRN
jgi:hypothetical protein